jgi:hypothetical protein
MKNRKKLIASTALIAVTLTAVPVAMAAQDSVRKWGYWENMTTPAAGPEPPVLITFTLPAEQPEHDPTPDPTPIPEENTLYGYTTVYNEGYYYAVSEVGYGYDNGVAAFTPYFDPEGNPDGTPYQYAYYKDNYYFNPTGTGGFGINPFGQGAANAGIGPYDSGNMPTDFNYDGMGQVIAAGYGSLVDGYPDDEVIFPTFYELADSNGDPTGLYLAYWYAFNGEQYLALGGEAVYGALTPLSYITGPALALSPVSDIKALHDMGDLQPLGNIQALYTGFTMQSGMDVTVGIDFNQSTFSAVFGAENPYGFAASGTLNGQHFQSTQLSGINNTLTVTGEVHGSLMNPEATAVTGAFDVDKIVVNPDVGLQEIHQAETFAATKSGLSNTIE